MLLEALCGASYQEIVDDYMTTYRNYYGITKETESKKYDTIVSMVLDPMIRSLLADENADLQTVDLSDAAEHFLSDVMSQEQIAAVKSCLTGDD